MTQKEFITEETARCIRCGYCLSNCPTYVVTGVEHSVARGRNYIAKSLLEEKIEFSKDVKKSVFECLLCGACIEHCAPSVRTSEIMTAVRAKYIEDKGQPPLQKYLFNEILPYPERMTRLMKLVSMGKRSGISGLVQALRVFGWFGKNIANMEGLLKSFPKSFLRELIPGMKIEKKEDAMKVGYFIGCGIDYAFPNVGSATISVLKKGGFDIHILENNCCGLPATGYGDYDAARKLARQNLSMMSELDCDVIITDCASCTSFLTDYPELFPEESEWREKAEAVSKKIMDVTEFLHRHMPDKVKKLSAEKSVTYHDPCHLGRFLKIKEAPRALISDIEGVSFRELPESNWCCGGAGTYNISHYDLSMKILSRKMKNLESTGAETLVTACPGCMVQLGYGVRKSKLPVEVKHISEIIDDSIDE